MLVVPAEETDPYPHIQRQLPGDFPVILKVRLPNLVALVVAMLRGVLGEALYESERYWTSISTAVSRQEICKSIARTVY